MLSVTAVIVAGGKGERMGAGENKVYMKLCGKEMLLYSIDVFDNNDLISDIVVVTDDIARCSDLIERQSYKKHISVVSGGKTRQQSVYNGLCSANGDFNAIHDGARALIRDKEINDVINDAFHYGAAALGVKCKDTLKRADKDGFIAATVDRQYTYLIQTPQVFKRDDILKAHETARREGLDLSDDCALIEHLGGKIRITEGSYENLKLTTPEDIAIAENILKKRSKK